MRLIKGECIDGLVNFLKLLFPRIFSPKQKILKASVAAMSAFSKYMTIAFNCCTKCCSRAPRWP